MELYLMLFLGTYKFKEDYGLQEYLKIEFKNFSKTSQPNNFYNYIK
ncbi:hypothetical protein KQI42_04775 [Tissierella sp. MSJ-40]|uniref:Uncharacterized protein n=1 Tax=Tissierella simiarum TaxID=2841534 RepID=A0ABS6E328_9FIRM|nr:hypothetical protein [Tissierella simiarum]MBU5437310.1 hypothetical protein [Tissierella simiarum]